METAEEIPHLGHVVQRKHELAPEFPEALFELSEIGFAEIEPVETPPPIRRIEIKERGGAVEPAEDLLVRQAFDLDAGQAAVRFFDDLRHPFGIEARQRGNVIVVLPATDQARIRVLLEVEEPGGALDIGEALRVLNLKQLEPLSAHDDELQEPQQFLIVELADPEEVHDIAVQVVQNFSRRRFLVKEHLRSARERLHVGGVLGEDRDDLLRDAVLATDVRKRAAHESLGVMGCEEEVRRLNCFSARLLLKRVTSLPVRAAR